MSSKKEQKRANEFLIWFNWFNKQNNNNLRWLIPIDKPNSEPHQFLNEQYWRLHSDYVKSNLHKGHKSDRHKIASLTEIVIRSSLPIEYKDQQDRTENEKIKLNVNFAIFCAIEIHYGWLAQKRKLFPKDAPSNVTFSDRQFLDGHFFWLKKWQSFSTSDIYSNSMSWFTFEKYSYLKAGCDIEDFLKSTKISSANSNSLGW